MKSIKFSTLSSNSSSLLFPLHPARPACEPHNLNFVRANQPRLNFVVFVFEVGCEISRVRGGEKDREFFGIGVTPVSGEVRSGEEGTEKDEGRGQASSGRIIFFGRIRWKEWDENFTGEIYAVPSQRRAEFSAISGKRSAGPHAGHASFLTLTDHNPPRFSFPPSPFSSSSLNLYWRVFATSICLAINSH